MAVTPQSARKSIALLALPLLLAGPSKALTAFIAPTDPATSTATWTGGGTSLQHYGIAFISGSS